MPCMVWTATRPTQLRVEPSGDSTAANIIESSTYTAVICHGWVDRTEVCLRIGAVGVMKESNWWGGNWTSASMRACRMSRPVSVAAQKYPGLSVHPICSAWGITSQVG
jgi:hypothetical protein